MNTRRQHPGSQTYTNTVLFASAISQSPIYPKSNDLHNVISKVTVLGKKHKERLLHHVDVEANQLLNNETVRRLKVLLQLSADMSFNKNKLTVHSGKP
jgi:hypothetical protein